MSEISSGSVSYTSAGDAADDAVFVDAILTITSQPESAIGIGTTADAVFIIDVDVAPAYAPLSYQWQEDSGSGFTNVINGGDYEGATSSMLTVTNNDDKDGYEYKVTITSGSVSVTSGIATITYA